MNKNIQKFIFYIAKVAVVALAFFFLFQRVAFKDLILVFTQPLHYPWLITMLFVVLWVLNLFIDAFFWGKVHQMAEAVNTKRALKINMVCYALSFITPFNSGEWVGRYLMMSDPANRKKSVFLNFWIHIPKLFAKLILTAIVLIGLLLLSTTAHKLIVITIGILLITIMLWIYRYVNRIQNWLEQKNIKRFALRDFMLDGRPNPVEKWTFLSLAAFKFISYNLQFALVLILFQGLNIPLEVFLAIPIYYLISALLPSVAIVDFIIKGAIAVWVFQTLWDQENILIISGVVIWIFNMVIPSFIGLYIIVKTNLYQSFKKRFSRDSRYDF